MRKMLFCLFCILCLAGGSAYGAGIQDPDESDDHVSVSIPGDPPLRQSGVWSRTVHFASLEWPPFSSPRLPGQGAMTRLLRDALAAVNVRMKVTFLPWNRAVESVRRGQFDGVFPVYFSDALREDFLFSRALGGSPLGFAERQDNPVNWRTLSDLRNRTLGTVRGYLNTAQFNHMARTGELEVESAPNDLSNLRKVAFGRIPLAVIDRSVFLSLRARYRSTFPAFSRLQFNDRPLEVKMMFVMIPRDPRGEELALLVNEALEVVDAQRLLDRWFEQWPITLMP